MKITSFILLAFFLQVKAEGFSQQIKVSLSCQNEELSKVFKDLEKQTNLFFFFNDKGVDTDQKVSLSVKDEELESVLKKVLGEKYNWEIVNNLIVVKTNNQDDQKKTTFFTGVVLDEKNSPLPGVTVRIKGSTTGTATDIDGVYKFSHSGQGQVVLVFSFVGFKTQEVEVKDAKSLSIILKEDITEMEEVVVTGYQQIDKRHLTSAVTSVKIEDIEVPGINRIDAMLEGRVPGLTYMQNTGQVGATPKLRIRGTSSILGNQEPLWVVDGIIQQDPVKVDPKQLNDLDFVNLLGNAISGLNPDDIERIDVLKDAAATALYGARAANGVIVISTKKGKVGPPSVSYTFSGTFAQRPRYTDRAFNMMNSKERVEVSKELMEKGAAYSGYTDFIGYEKAYIDYYRDGIISFDEFKHQAQKYETMNTDWLGILTQDAFSNSHSLSLNGGSENIRYYASVGYADEEGNVKDEYSKRYSSSLKLTANYHKFSAQFGINGSVTNKEYNPKSLNVMSYASKMSRAIPLRSEGGQLWYYNKSAYPFNIISEMDNSSLNIDQKVVGITGQVQYQFNNSFKLLGAASYQFSTTDEDEWFGEKSHYVRTLQADRDASTNMCPFGGTLKTNNITNDNYTLRLQADYNKYIDHERKHFTNAMFGYELSSSSEDVVLQELRGYYKDRGKGFAVIPAKTQAEVDKYWAYLGWLANSQPVYTEGLTNLMSAYLTLTYAYDNRYILNFNTRADWSNAFGSRSNEKLFPIWSASARWNLTEDVLKNVRWINNLALRFSYGLQGNMLNNQPIKMTVNRGTSYDTNYESYTSTVAAYPNPDLKWEKTQSYNAGMDFSILNNKVSGSLAFYYKKTTDAFLSKRVASQNGITTYVVNAGDVENKGVELDLRFTVIDRAISGNDKRGFVWRIDPQIGQALNKLLNQSLNRNNRALQDELMLADLLSGNAFISGRPLNTFYSFRYSGLDSHGRPTFKGLEDANKTELMTLYNIMAETDKKDVWFKLMEESGRRVPVLQGGIGNYVAYRNFSLSFNLTYSVGSKIRLFKLCSWDGSNTLMPPPHNNMRAEFVNRWRFSGDEKYTDIPGLMTGSQSGEDYSGWWREQTWVKNQSFNSKYAMYDNSDFRVASGDYLRLQSVVFRYTFDKDFLKKVRVSNAYVSLSGSNLFTICDKKLKGQNPEQSGATDIVNISLRPNYTVSLNINF